MTSYPPKSYAPRHPSPLSSPPASPALRPAGSPRQIQEINHQDEIIVYFINDAGQKHGAYTVHTRKGRCVSKCNYKDGLLDGAAESYYDTGKLMSLSQFRGGVHDGEVKRWAPNGQLLSHERYVGGQRVGLQESWYISGQPWQRWQAERGVHHGKYEIFDSSGNLLEALNYKDGKLHGVSIAHMRDGKVRESIYNYGALLRSSVKKPEDMMFDSDVLATL